MWSHKYCLIGLLTYYQYTGYEPALAAARRDPGVSAVTSMLSAVERELLTQAQATTSGNITQMAQILGWSRLTVREKLKLHGLRPEPSGA